MHCDLDLWPFDSKIYRAHPWLMGSLHVKFHDDRCKEKAVMRRKPFSVIYALWPWPLTFDRKIYRAHPWLKGSLHVQCHDDWCKGKAVMRRKPKCGRQTDGQTDMVIPVYPPNFVAGDIKRMGKEFSFHTVFMKLCVFISQTGTYILKGHASLPKSPLTVGLFTCHKNPSAPSALSRPLNVYGVWRASLQRPEVSLDAGITPPGHICVLNIPTQSVASPRTPHLSMIPIVIFTFELWSPNQ